MTSARLAARRLTAEQRVGLARRPLPCLQNVVDVKLPLRLPERRGSPPLDQGGGRAARRRVVRRRHRRATLEGGPPRSVRLPGARHALSWRRGRAAASIRFAQGGPYRGPSRIGPASATRWAPHAFRHNAYAPARSGGSTVVDTLRYALHRPHPIGLDKRLTQPSGTARSSRAGIRADAHHIVWFGCERQRRPGSGLDLLVVFDRIDRRRRDLATAIQYELSDLGAPRKTRSMDR